MNTLDRTASHSIGQLQQALESGALTSESLVCAQLERIERFNGQLNASLFEMRLSDFLWLLFLGILCTSFAFLATIEVVKRLGAFTVSLSINLEPVYTILLAIAILNENEILGSQFYIGSAIIVLVVISNAVIKYYLKSRSERRKQLREAADL